MVAPVHLAPSPPALARFRSPEPSLPQNSIFRRMQTPVQTPVQNAAVQAPPTDGDPAQRVAWTQFMGNAKRALQSWQRMPAGGHPIQPPYFTGVRGAPEVHSPIWTGRKDANGSIHIHPLAFPRMTPHLSITPGRTPLQPMTVALDGKTLSAASSMNDLEMANVLAETLDHAV